MRRGLADGSVRVVVGTHGLASERVRFARLGLVVIDEEQRFGDAHKIRFAGLAGGGAEAAHVMAMSATPIPRTLQEALVGLRDVSAGVARLDAGPQAAALTPRDLADARGLADTLGGRLREGRVILDIAEPRAAARVGTVDGAISGR